MKTRLDRSHELAYLKRYHRKKFKVQEEIGMEGFEPNIYTLGTLSTLDQMVTVDWWKKVGEKKENHAVEYRLSEVLRLITIGNWIILNK